MDAKSLLAGIASVRENDTLRKGWSRIARFIHPPNNEHHEKRDAILLGSILATLSLAWGSTFIGLYGCTILIAFLAGTRLAMAKYPIPGVSPRMVTIVAAIVSFYITLIEPTLGMLVAPLVAGGCLVRLFHRRVGKKRIASRWLRYLVDALVMGAGAFTCVLLYDWIYAHAIPAVHPYTVLLFVALPIILVLINSGLTLYCLDRMRTSKSIIYKLAPALGVVLFAAVFPMHESVLGSFFSQFTFGDLAEWMFALLVLVLAFPPSISSAARGGGIGRAFLPHLPDLLGVELGLHVGSRLFHTGERRPHKNRHHQRANHAARRG